MHKIEFTGNLIYPEQGMIIGNGDFCAAVFQRNDEIIWQLGKGDVWDRRIDYNLNPSPTDINELRHGVETERWKCGAYDNEVTALAGSDNPERMREICQPTPCGRRPYPMPKPVGELALKLPEEFHDLKVSYKLNIEEGILNITCTWQEQAELSIESFFCYDTDLLAVRYKFNHFKPEHIFFQLRRHADKSYPEFAYENNIAPDFPMCSDVNDCETLAPPKASDNKITQKFHPEPTFPEGFEYTLSTFSPDSNITSLQSDESKTARINITPVNTSYGTVMIKIKTSLTGDNRIPSNYDLKRKNTIKSSEKFWNDSSITLEDKFLENLWYETLHIQRSIFGRCPIPPGLMLPCTIGDYVRWHGDYHSNYNFQSPFWGLATANHPELLNSYFAGVDFFHIPGKFIAEKYYHCRGAFIQLNAFPIKAMDDWLGCCPMGRMVYMTGWIWHHHWDYYTHTGDLDFLRKRCWPLLKDCALFFIDFMEKDNNGNYHIFPSNCGEEPFTGDASHYRDRRENLQHAWYTLYITRKTAKLLDDNELVPIIDEMLDNWPKISPHDNTSETSIQNAPDNPPEFKMSDWINTSSDSEEVLFPPGHEFWTWYFGHAPMMYLTAMRNGLYKPERDYENFIAMLKHWREPNGTLTAMCSTRYGHTGAWTESLGIIGPLQEMLMTSWNNIIKIFPAVPEAWDDASFNNLRAEGAYLISAKRKAGITTYVKIVSEKGGELCLYDPFNGKECNITGANLHRNNSCYYSYLKPGQFLELSI